jgi:hypothetical protein
MIRSGVLYRSDAPLLGEPDPPVQPWPPRCVIDLRSPEELAGEPHPLTDRSGVVHAIPLLAKADPTRLATEAGTATLRDLYAAVVADTGELVAEIAGIVALADPPCLVHCAAGKDRTGVIVAILLAAVGVSRAEIIADYERTAANMPAVLERIVKTRPVAEQDAIRAQLAQVPAQLFATNVEAIDAVLDVVGATEHGAGGWLQAHGLSAQTLRLLRARLVAAA